MSSSPSRGGARAGGRRKESETGAEDAARSLMLEVVREQRALLREERARGDEAEGAMFSLGARPSLLPPASLAVGANARRASFAT